ncbi:hypothetical protein CPC08DRAFT_730181 [Agrocybe pediades]|nr:hypothetical protein CPC08DRAFT_730181 [Agrocybe pediades]
MIIVYEEVTHTQCTTITDRLHWTTKPCLIYSRTRLHQVIYVSGVWFDPAKGHPRTRLKILEKIIRWIVGQEMKRPIANYYMAQRGGGMREICICSRQFQLPNDVCYSLVFPSAEKILAETTAQDPHCDNGISTP